MSIATDLAAARAFIRTTIAAISIAGGYEVTIASASGNQTENPLSAPDSALPKAWVFSTRWAIRTGPVLGTGRIISPAQVDVWFAPARDANLNGEDFEPHLGAVVAAIYAASAPTRTKVVFADGEITGELTAANRACLRIPMTIEVTFTR